MDRQAERVGITERERAAVLENEADRLIPTTFWVPFTFGPLLFLIYPLRELMRIHTPPARLLVALIGMVIYAGIYLWLMLHEPFRAAPLSRSEVRIHVLLLAVIAIIVLALAISYTGTFLWFILYANVAAGVKLPARVGVVTIPCMTIFVFGVATVVVGWSAVNQVAPTVAPVSILMIGVSQMMTVIRELRRARREIARLAATEAVAEERLRFARDLHDLLGHSLSAITLKNELARRMVTKNPDGAMRELDETVMMSRAALREVREAVAGYRQPTLVTELQSARELLAAAGIACDCEDDVGALPPVVESTLAWVVREGVTNVVRHSRARHCMIRILRDAANVTAEVTDDGSGSVSCPTTDDTGNGLRGLAERAAQHGGHLEALPRVTGGFRLRVTLPIADGVASMTTLPAEVRQR